MLQFDVYSRYHNFVSTNVLRYKFVSTSLPLWVVVDITGNRRMDSGYLMLLDTEGYFCNKAIFSANLISSHKPASSLSPTNIDGQESVEGQEKSSE